ncbi:MAG: 8-oxo-dGTP diphosphatase [Patescibacteria group bacterium]|mgnify:CR=1 FL=1
MIELRNSTLLFLIKRSQGQVEEICLAMKKRGFGVGRWNGVGGKVEVGESIESAVKRETREEIGVNAKEIDKVAELTFYFPHNPSWNQLVHVYFCEVWEGDPVETEEMSPKWVAVPEIPFNQMWADDIFWLPEVLKGGFVKASFTFDEHDLILDQDIQVT